MQRLCIVLLLTLISTPTIWAQSSRDKEISDSQIIERVMIREIDAFPHQRSSFGSARINVMPTSREN
jgi:hypothetical protein